MQTIAPSIFIWMSVDAAPEARRLTSGMAFDAQPHRPGAVMRATGAGGDR